MGCRGAAGRAVTAATSAATAAAAAAGATAAGGTVAAATSGWKLLPIYSLRISGSSIIRISKYLIIDNCQLP